MDHCGRCLGTWDGSASTFNGQAYTSGDDLTINGSATKTITLSGTITTPLSLTISGTGTTGTTVVSSAGVPGTGAITLTGTSIGGTLSKTGNTDLVLATANAFGAVSISSGKFFLNNAAGLGTTGTLSVNSGAASGVSASYQNGAVSGNGTPDKFFYDSTNINASYTFSKNIAFGTVGTPTTYGMAMLGNALRTTTLSGNITGGSNITLWLDTSISDGSSIWSLTGNNSGFAGTLRLNRGRLFLSNANAAGTGLIYLDSISNAAGNIVLTNSFTLANNIQVVTSGNAISPQGNTVVLTGLITGAAWVKAGTGTLTLTSTNASASAVTVNAGTLNLDYSTNDTSKLSDTASLTLAGGTLNLSGGTHAEIVNATTLGAGTSAITRTAGSATLVLNGITRNAGSTLELGTAGIVTTSSTLGGANNSVATTSLGVLGVFGGNDWIARNAAVVAPFGLVGFSTVGAYTATTATTISGNADVAAGVTGTTLTNGSASTIRFNQAQATTITDTGTLSLTNGGILVTAAVGSNSTTIAGGTLVGGSGSNSINIFQNNTAGGMTISSVIADRSQTGNASYASGILVKSGAGTLTLGAANTYTGQTYLNGGTTIISADNSIGGTNGTVANLTSLTTTTSVTYTGTLPTGLGIGTAILGSTITAINDNTKTITLAGNATTALTGGTASWANAVALNLNGGTLQTTANITMTETNAGGTAGTTTANRAVVLGGNGGTFNTNSSTTLTLAGVISGGGVLTKAGTGTLTLSGTNTFSGGTTINAGTVAIGNSSALGTAAVNANSSYSPTYTSGGAPFLMTTASGLTVANNIALSSTAGYYALQMGSAAGGTVNWSGTISGGGAGVVLQIDTPNSGDNSSVATLSGNSTFAGQLRLNRGNLTLANANAVGVADLFIQTPTNTTTGNLIFSNSFTLANNIGLGVSTAGSTSPAISTGANNVTLSGVISSVAGAQGTNAGFTKIGSGTLTLSNANTYTGPTTITAGTLALTSTGSTGAGAVTVQTGGTILGTGTVRGSSFTADSGSTLRAGDSAADSSHGTLTFTPTSASGTTYSLQGSIVLGISTATATLNLSGVTLGSVAYNALVDGVTGVGSHDRLVFTNPTAGSGYTLNFVTTTGSLQVAPSGFTAAAGQVFNLLDWSTLVTTNFTGFTFNSGQLVGNGDEGADLDLPDLTGTGLFWDFSRFTFSGNIVVVPEPGRMGLLMLGISVLALRRRR